MKKIIDGKCYNTETATLLGDFHNGIPSDFHYVYEALYRSKKGTLFLYYKGGPLSEHGVSCGNGMGWGEGIDIMTEDQAKWWAEKKLSAEEYENIFGEIEEG